MATLGNGTVVTIGGISGNLLSVNGPNYERAFVETTHMGTTAARTYVPDDQYDPGTLEIELEFDAGQSTTLPMTAATTGITIAYSGTAAPGFSWSASGHMTSFSPSAAIGERMTARATFKLTGALTTA